MNEAMTSPLDIYRTAKVLIEQYGGDDAVLMAAKRADALLALGDIDGQIVWKRVLQAVQELTRTERKPSEPVN